jgi:putative ABC transport system permease protein
MVGTLRNIARSIDPQLPLTQVEYMEAIVEEGQAPRRFNTALISSFAGAAVLLALLGIYSVIAYSAVQRTQEMAIRLALGWGCSVAPSVGSLPHLQPAFCARCYLKSIRSILS